MPTWDIECNFKFTITSDDITTFPSWEANSGAFGPRRQINAERQFLEDRGRHAPDHLIAYYLSFIDPNSQGSLRASGAPVASGTDGEFVVSGSEFLSTSVGLSPAMVGRIIHITNANTPSVIRGFYRINNRNNPSSVNVDGILPQSATGLTFDIYDPGEVLVILANTTPV